MTVQEYLHEKTGWYFDPESKLWFPPDGPLELPDEEIPDSDMEFIAQRRQRQENKIAAQQRGGIPQSELCIRFNEPIGSVSSKAKSRGMTAQEYLHQKTGWHFNPESELWLPPDDSDTSPEHSASSNSVSLPTLYEQDRIAARQRGGLTQQELCSRFGENSCSLGARAKPRGITIKEYLHRRSGWNFEPESKLWFPPDESEEDPAPLPLFLGHRRIAAKQKGGLTKQELCERFNENPVGIGPKAKRRGLTIEEYLHQATGWHFKPELKLWFPPDESEEGSPPLAKLLGCNKIAIKQRGGLTQKELCARFNEHPSGIGFKAKRKGLTINEYLHQATGWHFESETELWLPPDESEEGSPPLVKLLTPFPL
jgi:alkylated DNA repair dioxygenase AlkB